MDAVCVGIQGLRFQNSKSQADLPNRVQEGGKMRVRASVGYTRIMRNRSNLHSAAVKKSAVGGRLQKIEFEA